MGASWTGNISFGMVTIPIGLHKAVEDKTVTLNQIHLSDCGQVRYIKRCESCEQELTADEIGSGYKLADGKMVAITDDELDGLPITAKKTCEVIQFVTAGQVDPLGMLDAYFVQPREGAMAFALLHGAMTQTGLSALCRLVFRSRQKLALLSVRDEGMLLTTIRWPDEVRQPSFPMPEVTPRPQELKMAVSLVKTLALAFDPATFRDDYREALASLVAAKSGGQPVKSRSKAEAAPTSDVAAALRASLEAAKAARPTKTPVRAKQAEGRAVNVVTRARARKAV